MPTVLHSDRLLLRPVAAGDIAALHALVTDPHVRRYLMDGQILPLAWTESTVAASESRFAETGLGLWLAYHGEKGEPVGFCGFLQLPDTGLGPELVYALREAYTGRGFATEMGKAMLAEATARGLTTVSASVDAVNAASVHILEKLGFQAVATRQGSFGDLLVMARKLQPAGPPLDRGRA